MKRRRRTTKEAEERQRPLRARARRVPRLVDELLKQVDALLVTALPGSGVAGSAPYDVWLSNIILSDFSAKDASTFLDALNARIVTLAAPVTTEQKEQLQRDLRSYRRDVFWRLIVRDFSPPLGRRQDWTSPGIVSRFQAFINYVPFDADQEATWQLTEVLYSVASIVRRTTFCGLYAMREDEEETDEDATVETIDIDGMLAPTDVRDCLESECGFAFPAPPSYLASEPPPRARLSAAIAWHGQNRLTQPLDSIHHLGPPEPGDLLAWSDQVPRAHFPANLRRHLRDNGFSSAHGERVPLERLHDMSDLVAAWLEARDPGLDRMTRALNAHPFWQHPKGCVVNGQRHPIIREGHVVVRRSPPPDDLLGVFESSLFSTDATYRYGTLCRVQCHTIVVLGWTPERPYLAIHTSLRLTHVDLELLVLELHTARNLFTEGIINPDAQDAVNFENESCYVAHRLLLELNTVDAGAAPMEPPVPVPAPWSTRSPGVYLRAAHLVFAAERPSAAHYHALVDLMFSPLGRTQFISAAQLLIGRQPQPDDTSRPLVVLNAKARSGGGANQ